MNHIRWGLCCKFHEEPIKFRTTTVAYVSRLSQKGIDPLSYLRELIVHNLAALEASILYCAKNRIGSFRINSDFLPIYTHPQFGYQLTLLANQEQLMDLFAHCRALAKAHNVRLTFHPDQFVVLNSPHEHVVTSSIAELEYHALVAEWLDADVVNIHAGGVYGDKSQALARWKDNFSRLSERARTRLTLENDDRCFSPEDLLPLCQSLRIPLIYDVHHHRCLSDNLSIEQASELAYATWNREPLFHLSSPKDGWQGPKPERHHDYIQLEDFPLCWLEFPSLTVDIEAKAKEVAIAKLDKDIEELKRKRGSLASF